ncbi:MAG: sigma-70 family RNA polymerase sigma factor [Thermoguttaceae bacterium]|nr:sigma-70 family RNA polymerase sigma factor [Thermoguttaceae bacterium]
MSANAIVEKETSSEQTERETQKATPRRKRGKSVDLSNVSPDAVAKYEPLIRSLCQSGKYGSALTYDEKFSAGTLGALRALATFDSTRGTSEAFWVSYQADAAIKREARKARRRVVCVDSAAFDFIAERSESPDETASRNEERELFRAALETLDERSRRLVQKIGLEGRRQREVAAEEGISQSWASRLYRRALDKIRRYVVEGGVDRVEEERRRR